MMIKNPTKTSLVFDELVEAADFRTTWQLAEATRLNIHEVRSSVEHLMRYSAVEYVEAQGVRWYFATPLKDTRRSKLASRASEVRARQVGLRAKDAVQVLRTVTLKRQQFQLRLQVLGISSEVDRKMLSEFTREILTRLGEKGDA